MVKTVEVKKTIAERLAEHDIFDCPECRKVIDEYLAKKDLEIVQREDRCPKCGMELEKRLFGGDYCPKCSMEFEI